MNTRKTSHLGWDEFNLLLNNMRGNKMRLLFAIQGYCGLRVGDVLNLKWGDIIGKDNISLNEQKTGKSRTVYINENLKKIIKEEYKEQYSDVFVFKNKYHNTPMSVGYVNRFLKRIFKENNIEYTGNVSSHLFRKTFGRRVMDVDNWSDKSLVLLNEIYGHATISTTKIYLGIRQEEIKNVYHSLI